MFGKTRKELKAIHEEDLEDILKKLEQYDDFTNNKISCEVCKDVVNLQNIGSAKVKNGKLIFTCKKIPCYNQIVKKFDGT